MAKVELHLFSLRMSDGTVLQMDVRDKRGCGVCIGHLGVPLVCGSHGLCGECKERTKVSLRRHSARRKVRASMRRLEKDLRDKI